MIISAVVTEEIWRQVIAERVPAKAKVLNLEAFKVGRQAVSSQER